MRVGTAVNRLVGIVNTGVVGLAGAPVIGPLVRRRLTVITYVGRRSGRSFSTPVAYRRDGDVVAIGVSFPDSKSWWRNFLDDGGPITLRLDDRDRTGHATSRRDAAGRVGVIVRLDPVDGRAG